MSLRIEESQQPQSYITFANDEDFNNYLNKNFKVVYNNFFTQEDYQNQGLSTALKLANLIFIGELHSDPYRRIHCPVIDYIIQKRDINCKITILGENSREKTYSKDKLPYQVPYLNPQHLDNISFKGWDDDAYESHGIEVRDQLMAGYCDLIQEQYETEKQILSQIINSIKNIINILNDHDNQHDLETKWELFKEDINAQYIFANDLRKLHFQDKKKAVRLFNDSMAGLKTELANNVNVYQNRIKCFIDSIEKESSEKNMKSGDCIISIAGNAQVDYSIFRVPNTNPISIQHAVAQGVVNLYNACQKYKTITLTPKNQLAYIHEESKNSKELSNKTQHTKDLINKINDLQTSFNDIIQSNHTTLIILEQLKLELCYISFIKEHS